MKELFVTDEEMSFALMDLSPLQNIRCGLTADGERSRIAVDSTYQYLSLGLTGKQFGKMKIISDIVFVTCHKNKCKGKWMRKRKFVLTQCQCGEVAWKNIDNVKMEIAGCRVCDKPRIIPKWLYARCFSALDRCTNPQNKAYKNYGGRGITFGFSSPMEMAKYIFHNFDITNRKMDIDRIDNRLGYCAGNIRMTTKSINSMNTRHQNKVKMLIFREKHPEIKYADATLCHFFSIGMREEEIVKKFYLHSNKPKGKYGTFSTAAPDIVSQLMVY